MSEEIKVPKSWKELADENERLRAAWNEAKAICETGLSFHADCFGFTSWLEKYGELK
jgi:hypothetical protein